MGDVLFKNKKYTEVSIMIKNMWELRKTLLKAQTEKLQGKVPPLMGNNRIWKPDTGPLPRNQITRKENPPLSGQATERSSHRA